MHRDDDDYGGEQELLPVSASRPSRLITRRIELLSFVGDPEGSALLLKPYPLHSAEVDNCLHDPFPLWKVFGTF